MLPDGFLSDQSNWPEMPIRCNARFFKIRLFNSDGPAQAPLLMSATFELQSEQEVAGLPRRWTPGFATSLPMILLIAAFALYVSWRIYGATAHLRQRKGKSRAELNKELKLLQSDPSVIPLSEKLNRLGQDDSRQNRD